MPVYQFRMSLVAFMALLIPLGGCASDLAMRRITSPEAIAAGVPQGATQHRILVATTRAPDDNPEILFSGERGDGVSFAEITVSVPPDHETGETERVSRGLPDPSRHFVATDIRPVANSNAFTQTARAGSSQDVLVFVHGYRNTFADALFRITQIVHDTGFQGTAILFSWASRGSTLDYIYDRDSATAARDALEYTLRNAARANPRRIDIMAHSMGTWVTMEALRQLKISGDPTLGGRLGDVILASPDISADVFKAQMQRYGKPRTPFFVLLSRDDRALQLSQVLAGNKPRLGAYTDDKEIAELGVVVVNLTEAGSSGINHTKFAQNPQLVALLGERLRSGEKFNPERNKLGTSLATLGVGVGTVLESTARVIVTTPQAVFQTALPQ
ncbi:MAG: alpha/beta hydrolase [Zhengella sp.]|uniref:alpha/beta hydrolase n=1 Tax=Zhengella sp. TaxID=2282762 RepID=UPI001DEC89FB|nr:alpha/beta hydrolase [Notoacmeibacter sp.]MCC0027877.1 alpha/beta hydrolase [Brucellaceae bacterium]